MIKKILNFSFTKNINKAKENSTAFQNNGPGNMHIYQLQEIQKSLGKVSAGSDFQVWLHYNSNQINSLKLFEKLRDIISGICPSVKFYPDSTSGNELYKSQDDILFDDVNFKTPQIFKSPTSSGLNIILLDDYSSYSVTSMLAEHTPLASNSIILTHKSVSLDNITKNRSGRMIAKRAGSFIVYDHYKEVYPKVERFIQKKLKQRQIEITETGNYNIKQILFIALRTLETASPKNIQEFLIQNLDFDIAIDEIKDCLRKLGKEDKIECVNTTRSLYRLTQQYVESVKDSNEQLLLLADEVRMLFISRKR